MNCVLQTKLPFKGHLINLKLNTDAIILTVHLGLSIKSILLQILCRTSHYILRYVLHVSVSDVERNSCDLTV